MQLDTRHFGLIEIDSEQIIDFPEGIPGFEDQKKFIILENEESQPFKWLQCIDDTDLAFVIIDPKVIKFDYEVEIDDCKVEVLEINDVEKVLIYLIVVVTDNPVDMTVNLKAPILINSQNKKGKQILMDNDNYPIKYYFMKHLTKAGG